MYWKNKMILVLKSKGLWTVISGLKKKPTMKEEDGDEPTAEFEAAMLEWQTDDDKAMATIVLHLEHEPYSIVMRCKTSKAK